MLKNISKRSLFLFFFDMGAAISAYQLSAFLWFPKPCGFYSYWLPFLALAFTLLIFFYIFDLYYPFKRFKNSKTIVDVLLALGVGTLAYGLICFLTGRFFLPRFLVLYFVWLFFIFTLLVRFAYDVIFKSRFLDKKTVIFGTGAMAGEIGSLIEATPHSGMDVIGHIAENEDSSNRRIRDKEILGHAGQLISLLDWHNIGLLVLACEEESKASEFEIMRLLADRNIQIVSAVHLFEKLGGSIPYDVIDPKFILTLASDVRGRHFLHFKRLLDILVSALLLTLTLPLSALVIFLLSFHGFDKIFFVQKRVGKNGKTFLMYKFRSMSAPSGGEPQVTSLGRILRKFRLDELPQFLNVLKGDMSLIGPRPEPATLVKKCLQHIPYYNIVFTVRPGISGWAQVNFGYVSDSKGFNRDYPKKFCYNVYYLKNISLELDLQIFLKTVRIILMGKGK